MLEVYIVLLTTMGNEQIKHVQDRKYPSGNVYSGEMVGNKREGQGTLTWKDGARYEGSWHDDLCHGQGKMSFPNGSVYEGGFVRNNVYGQGKLTTVNGEVLDGFWEYQGRSDTANMPVGKYKFIGELIDVKTGQRRPYNGPLAFYLLSGLVSLPNMPDPMEALFPYAVVLPDDGGKGSSAIAEQGRVLFQQGLSMSDSNVAYAVQTAPSSSSSINYGQPDVALQQRHRDDHVAYSLLDPRLYLASLGVPTQPANINRKKQEALQQAATNQSSSAVPIAVPVEAVSPPPAPVSTVPVYAAPIQAQGYGGQPQAIPTPQDNKPNQPMVFF